VAAAPERLTRTLVCRPDATVRTLRDESASRSPVAAIGGSGCGRGRPRRSYGVHVTSGVNPRLEDIELTEHAVEQYRERARPALDLAGARCDLARLVSNGDVFAEPPDWARSAGSKPFYLVIGDALAFPLAPQAGRWVTTTCLVKTTLTPRRRDERQQYKARRASAKRAQRRARG
jgi:hypothetical protein